MKIPKKIEDLEKLIKAGIPESLYLDFKASPALSKKKLNEICKDVSSFANSDGGVLVYGILEKDDLPYELDNGVDTKTINREWIDQILSTHIIPTIEGIEVNEIKKSNQHSYFVVSIPKSFRGPHQSADKKYYKRFNFISVPMEHYEIEDVRNRRSLLPQLVNFDVDFDGHLIRLKIENIGNDVAHEVKFEFPKDFKWYRGELPNALKNGIKFFPPGRKIIYTLGSSSSILGENSKYDTSFDVAISYFHPFSESKVQEIVHIDFLDYFDSTVERNPLVKISQSIEVLADIQTELNKINASIKKFNAISGATGIDVSLRTLKNLRHIFTGSSDFEPIDIRYYDYNVIQEVLNIDFEMASKIYDHFHYNPENTPLEEIEGITDELLEKIKKLTKQI
ncbi:AlbA family DNA-binding domain-containing protein [Desulfonema magnum]|uniref:Schlafen domain-containing protein n=1 Tax=Desulfonema magnum TaxID=45655 RepID=A0A975BI32_9BACT|nr:ATP-binding protein [Desulfonema magnum]QTA85715.1 Schlafen domain-containing protein [Desulfonema magnum]